MGSVLAEFPSIQDRHKIRTLKAEAFGRPGFFLPGGRKRRAGCSLKLRRQKRQSYFQIRNPGQFDQPPDPATKKEEKK
jgi:hypothetical protein